MINSLIIGGRSGIGSVIRQAFEKRGDQVFTASTRASDESNHFVIDLPDKIAGLSSMTWDNIVFTHRYRGEDWSREFDITVRSIDSVLTYLSDKLNFNGSVVILGSQASRLVFSEQTLAYHSSRAALEGVVKYLAVSFGKKKIRCNLINPPTLMKPENIEFYSTDSEDRRLIEKITPLSRMGCSEDIANLVEFLCSNKSSFITGQTFNVDGGLSLVSHESIARSMLD